MKSLIIPFICMILICFAWFVSFEYTMDTTTDLILQLSDIYDDAQAGDWERAGQSFLDFQDDWTKYSGIYTYYINSSDLDRADCAVAMCKGYLNAQDSGLVCGQLAKIIQILQQIELYSHPSFDAIF